MTVVLVQSKISGGAPITPNTTPTPGNLAFLFAATRNLSTGPATIAGWTAHTAGVLQTTLANPREHMAFYRVIEAGDSSWLGTSYSSTVFTYMEFSGAGAFQSDAGTIVGLVNTVVCGGAIATTGPVLLAGGMSAAFINDTETMITAPSAGVTEVSDKGGASGAPGFWTGYRVETANGTYTVGGTATMGSGGAPRGMAGHTFVFGGSLEPVADFDADVYSGVVPLTVNFTDLSTNTPTSWAWTFGDGGTSTSQNPSHIYTGPGTYSVTLTATNGDGSDSETKATFVNVIADVGYEPPLPAGALIEIYAAEAGAYRWDVATWDDAVWSTGAWQDVTPESVDATIVWGSISAELGILSKASAGAWAINTYDPQRLLDPANEDGPWFTDLVPYLPVRVSHRGLVIRQGIAESIGYDFETDMGQIRVMDNIGVLANAAVPPDVTLADTLYARAVDAIAAAGLAVTVLPVPPSGDPALAPWVADTSWSAWEWISDAAEQVLHVAYIDNIGRVGFRPWALPLARGRTLDATELVGLASIAQYGGMYSVIRVLDDDGVTVVERSLPPGRYGTRTYERFEPTIDSGAWADAVLADRAFSTLRWVPGTVYPLTADAVEAFATIEAVELVGLTHAYTDPEVLANLIIVGGEIELTAKSGDEAKWWFTYEAAQTPLLPLATEDESGFITNETETAYLYPG